MKKLLLLLGILLLCGCGPESVYHSDITLHEMSKFDFNLQFGTEYCGYAIWDGEGNCDIYLGYESEYRSERVYHEIMGHEARHCFKQEDFHGPGPTEPQDCWD